MLMMHKRHMSDRLATICFLMQVSRTHSTPYQLFKSLASIYFIDVLKLAIGFDG
jgi:hypothetical protein